MGPQPSSRGNRSGSLKRSDSGRAWLQWGRNLPVAEIIRSGRALADADRNRFNGAATFQSRKLDRSGRRQSAPKRVRLQWGRNLPVAEIGARGKSVRCMDALASMGPQPSSRGNAISGDTNDILIIEASMGPQPSSRGNGTERLRHDGGKKASMGPQPSSRGNSVRASICVALTPFCAGFPLRGMLVPYYLSVRCRHFDS